MKKLKSWQMFLEEKKTPIKEITKRNNQAGDLIKYEDISDCIRKNSDSDEKKHVIFATIVQEIPKNDPETPLFPVDIDEDGLITVEQDEKIGYVKLKDVEKIGMLA